MMVGNSWVCSAFCSLIGAIRKRDGKKYYNLQDIIGQKRLTGTINGLSKKSMYQLRNCDSYKLETLKERRNYFEKLTLIKVEPSTVCKKRNIRQPIHYQSMPSNFRANNHDSTLLRENENFHSRFDGQREANSCTSTTSPCQHLF